MKFKSPLQEGFERFRAVQTNQVMHALRSRRATAIQELLKGPDIDVETFEREVWRLGDVMVDGKKFDWSANASATAYVAEHLEELTHKGNGVWRHTTYVFAASADIATREKSLAKIQQIARTELGGAETYVRLRSVFGLGPAVASGIAMLLYPSEFAIFNGPSIEGVQYLKRLAKEQDFQASVQALREEVGADDFLELDWFLFRVKHFVKLPIDPPLPLEDGTPPLPPSEPSNAQNVILYGPPGTGKTYVTSRRAAALCVGEVNITGDVSEQFGELRRRAQIEFVTFHQSYGYEEFVEGIRPVMDADANEGVQYRLEDGVFKRMALRAASEGVVAQGTAPLDPPAKMAVLRDILREGRTHELNYDGARQYVLIIDEINRGNMSKILGELITLLEPSKRLTKSSELMVQLPYSKERFAVPPNLHVIGTMNTADRSIALMDVALRRRFRFEEMLPRVDVVVEALTASVVDDVLGGRDEFINLVAALFECINARIRLLYDDDHQLGHAYFMSATSYDELRATLLNNVIPMLQEYFYGSWDRVCTALGCPYAASAPARRGLMDGDTKRYRAPFIMASPVEERGLLGFDHSDFEDVLEYAINPQLRDGSDEELRNMCEDVLSGKYQDKFINRKYFP